MVSLSKYIQILELNEGHPDFDVEGWENDPDAMQAFWSTALHQIAIWKGFEVGTLAGSYTLERTISVFNDLCDALHVEEDETFEAFEFEGVQYVLPDRLMTKSNFSEFAECNHYLEEVQELEHGNIKAIPKLMAILCRPHGEQYDPENVQRFRERVAIFERVDAWTAMQCSFFLQRLVEKYKQASLAYGTAQALAVTRGGATQKSTVGTYISKSLQRRESLISRLKRLCSRLVSRLFGTH